MSAIPSTSRIKTALIDWVAKGGLDPSTAITESLDQSGRPSLRVQFIAEPGLSIFCLTYSVEEHDEIRPYVWLEAALAKIDSERRNEAHAFMLSRNQRIPSSLKLAVNGSVALLVHRSPIAETNFESFTQLLSEFIGMATEAQQDLADNCGLDCFASVPTSH